MPTYDPQKSLSDNLATFGFLHADAGNGIRDVVDASGVVVCTGRYEEVAAWLKGVDVAALRALLGWEVRLDGTDGFRPYARHSDPYKPDRTCTVTPPSWPLGAPGMPLCLSEWVHDAAGVFDAL